MRRLARAVTVFAIVGGPPLLAALSLRHTAIPEVSIDGVRGWLQQPRTVTDVLAGLAVVAALLWLMLIGHLARRGLHTLRRRRRRPRPLRLPTAAEMTAGSMAGVAALTLPTAMIDPGPDQPVASGGVPPADPTPHDHHDRAASDIRAEPGIDLPGGGWMPHRTAAAVAAMATTIWLLRRRTYHPDPRHLGTHHHDADLQPLPATVHAVTATAHAAPGGPAPPVLPHPLPPGLLHLHGPGAQAAARGLIVTAAVTAATTPSATVLAVHRDDWNVILPGYDDVAAAIAGVTVVPDDDTEQQRENPGDKQPTTGTRQPAQPADPHARAGTVLTLVDTPAAGTRWHVAADGTTTTATGSAVPSRLCILDRQAAGDLLTLLRRRHHPPPDASAATPAAPAAASPQDSRSYAARLRLLGECALTVAGQPVRLRRSASVQILAFLALHPAGATRSAIIAAVWPHLPPSSITQRFHTTLSDLRQQLRPAITDAITRHEDHYRLNTDQIETDVGQWRATVAEAAHAIGAVARSDACRKLSKLYQGELAANQPWPWILPLREQLRRDALDAHLYLADHTDPGEARVWLRKAVTIDPYNAWLQTRSIRRETSAALLNQDPLT